MAFIGRGHGWAEFSMAIRVEICTTGVGHSANHCRFHGGQVRQYQDAVVNHGNMQKAPFHGFRAYEGLESRCPWNVTAMKANFAQ
jgi:hypothetical protein